MGKRRSQLELAEEAEARVRKEEARLRLEQIRHDKERISLKREACKAKKKMLSVHRAAEQNRFTKDWNAPSTSADSEIIPDMVRMNNRARDAVRDEAWAKSIVRAFRRNRVGTGIWPMAEEKPWYKAFMRWAKTPQLCDIEGKRTLLNVLQWANDDEVIVGEAFVVRWIVNGNLQLQCFEFEQLDSYTIKDKTTGNEVRHGIEINQDGRVVAYHFFRRHPNDVVGMARPAPLTLESMRIPAAMVSHVFDIERAKQSHGRTRFHSILRKLRDLSEFDAAQLRAARAEASIGLLITGSDDGEEDDTLEIDGLGVAYLGEDESVTPFTPQRPGNTYQPFMIVQLSALSAGAGLNPAQITREYTGNFSSQRQGSIDDPREIAPLRQSLITQLCTPILEDFESCWHMRNYTRSASYWFFEDTEPIEWMGQGDEWVDPEQQGKGIERQMRLGLTNRTREARKLGTTPQQIDKESAKDGTLDYLDRLQPDKRESPEPDQPATPTTDSESVKTEELADAT